MRGNMVARASIRSKTTRTNSEQAIGSRQVGRDQKSRYGARCPACVTLGESHLGARFWGVWGNDPPPAAESPPLTHLNRET